MTVLTGPALATFTLLTLPLTLPGFAHDICSAIHPMGAASPIFRRLGLTGSGLEWISAPLALAHPLDDGRVAVVSRRVAETAASLGADGRAWLSLLGPFVERHEDFFSGILRPVRVPRHPWLMARFGRLGLMSSDRVARRFEGDAARALLAGNAAHSCLALDAPGSAAIAARANENSKRKLMNATIMSKAATMA